MRTKGSFAATAKIPIFLVGVPQATVRITDVRYTCMVSGGYRRHLFLRAESIIQMITEKEPQTWQQLQVWCAQIFHECGWQAKTEVTVDLVRGRAEIDVLATETVRGREYKTLVECKNWSSRVPQHVVHSFRTVVADVGANAGYIVSMAGFQAGAYQAVEHTNVKLLTWHEFQEIFEQQWYWEYLTKYVVEHLEPLGDYLEPIPAMTHWDQYLEKEEVERLKQLYREHQPLGVLIMALSPYIGMLNGQSTRLELPLEERARLYSSLPQSICDRTGYREFIAELQDHCMPILNEFRQFRDIAFARRDAAAGDGGAS